MNINQLKSSFKYDWTDMNTKKYEKNLIADNIE